MARGSVAVIAALASAALLVAGVAAERRWGHAGEPTTVVTVQLETRKRPLTSASAAPMPAPPPMPHPARWLAFGGGAEPSSNQVSMENDLALAADVLGPGGILLFAGGPNSDGVYVLDESDAGDDFAAELADLIAPRSGRDARYRRTVLRPHGAATKDETLAALRSELAGGDAPLLVYVDCHGDGGDNVLDNDLALWGGDSLSVKQLIEALDEARRPVRVVMSACFSGGFAEMAFAGGKPQNGATPRDRCGLFATTWDLEATGCDPDPDRRNHEGYAVHFLHALRGEDRLGGAIAADVDGDGHISLFEAHTRARIASEGLDVPTTTSERWLREAAPKSGPGIAVSLPEEDATIAALGKRLELDGDAAAVRAAAEKRYQDLEARYDVLARREDKENAEVERLRRIVKAELLARWPVIDDPWHPEFHELLERSSADIDRFLGQSASYKDYLAARQAAEKTSADRTDLALERAPLERLVRAFDTRELAGRLKKRGGKAWQAYERLLACERTVLR